MGWPHETAKLPELSIEVVNPVGAPGTLGTVKLAVTEALFPTSFTANKVNEYVEPAVGEANSYFSVFASIWADPLLPPSETVHDNSYRLTAGTPTDDSGADHVITKAPLASIEAVSPVGAPGGVGTVNVSDAEGPAPALLDALISNW